ncbi:MAG: hypothetical protein QOK11_540 [Pseudonocardiales bacterium]|nr:hypothetical protein [Pseudonocardiales bacterium]
MDALLGMFHDGVGEFGARVKAVDAGQWGSPTPDTDWCVADLVGHLTEEHRWIPPLLDGHDLEAAGKIVAAASVARGSGVGDLAAEWEGAARASLDAVGEPDALERSVALSRGSTPARQYLAEMIFDLVLHSWDLGTAIGYRGEFPPETVEFVYSQVKDMGDLSGTGMFAAPVDVLESAPTMTKLLAATGRTPR